MTILVEQPDLGFQVEDKVTSDHTNNELVLDGGFAEPKPVPNAGFVAPEINSFGHTST
ncbi:hypothetical protein Acr_00g0084540 [Actinidia rufa]|uniref:Uncharacterized protein n=1 Tax=Actinidia rufa TaxID=165716 RepID=A0A7J0DX08_9ERIC|nr:hypothetical protein Acr_00g0084540 [Actinidia rufa]